MNRALPASLEQVRGLRAARWIRESTTGQYDNFGPDAQREQQDRAIERYGLLDSGLEWAVASSGWKSAWRTPAWEDMLRSAEAGEFDVLVVGYVSRFLRNLKQTLDVVEDQLRPAGVAVLFVDEQILTSDLAHWDQFISQAHEAETYSRRLSKRVGEGYAVKRRRFGVPGGNRAPFGIIREGRPSILRIDEPRAVVVRQAFDLAAADKTDWEVAAETGLRKTHVAEILTNPIYAGHLRTSEPAGIAPIISPAVFTKVQTARERRRTRTPGRIVKRHYALRLCCAGCGRYLHGDVGRYRHPAPTCEPFRAARPELRRRGRRTGDDTRVKGHSYPQNWYEDAIGALLARVGRVDDRVITEIVRRHAEYEQHPDQLGLARIERARDEAARQLNKTRDIDAWRATTARLDAEEAIARQFDGPTRLSAVEIVDYLRSLPRLWADAGPDAPPDARRGHLRSPRRPRLPATRVRAHARCNRPWIRRRASACDRSDRPDW